MKCYDTLLSKKGLINNYGFFVLLVIIFIFMICIILFYIKEQNSFKKIIDKIIIYKKNIKTFQSIENTFKELIINDKPNINTIKKIK